MQSGQRHKHEQTLWHMHVDSNNIANKHEECDKWST